MKHYPLYLKINISKTKYSNSYYETLLNFSEKLSTKQLAIEKEVLIGKTKIYINCISLRYIYCSTINLNMLKIKFLNIFKNSKNQIEITVRRKKGGEHAC
jgi:hypothetical protein